MPQNTANLKSGRNPENFTNYLEAEKNNPRMTSVLMQFQTHFRKSFQNLTIA